MSQFAPAQVLEGRRYAGTAGDRYWALELVSLIRMDQRGSIWSCRCSCGREVVRGIWRLNDHARRGLRQSCRDCVKVANRALLAMLAACATVHFREQWRDIKTLWGEGQLALIEQDIRQAIEADQGPAYDPPFSVRVHAGFHEDRSGALDALLR